MSVKRLITVQVLGGERKTIEIPHDANLLSFVDAIKKEFCLGETSTLKLICGGAVVGDDTAHGKKKVTDIEREEVVLAMHVKASSSTLPPSWISSSKENSTRAGDIDEDEEEEEKEIKRKFEALPVSAMNWERQLVSLMRRAGSSSWLIGLLIFVRPVRVVWISLFFIILFSLNRIDKALGPPFILIAILAAIFSNLSNSKKPGELSAYSICNEGVRRLPGQLDADDVDEQMRRGQI